MPLRPSVVGRTSGSKPVSKIAAADEHAVGPQDALRLLRVLHGMADEAHRTRGDPEGERRGKDQDGQCTHRPPMLNRAAPFLKTRRLLGRLSAARWPGGDARDRLPGRNVASHDGARADERARPDPDAAEHDRTRPQRRSALDDCP